MPSLAEALGGRPQDGALQRSLKPRLTFAELLEKKLSGGGSGRDSQILKTLWSAITAPGRAFEGNPLVDGVPLYDPQQYEQQRMEDAMNVAGTAMTGGFALGRAPVGSLGMNVYHGSPHKFEKFDMGKIGTGEGAQAYGHGLYFAENPQVAKNYQFAGQAAYANNQVAEKAFRALEVSGGDEVAAKSWLNKRAAEAPPDMKQQYYDALNNFDTFKSKKNLYKVDLPDEHIAKMLDWDKPLSQQPESVRGAAESLMPQLKKRLAYLNSGAAGKRYASVEEMPGQYLYDAVVQGKKENQVEASMLLKQLGIPGIKYLDQGSRTGGKGTSNFVVFDDKLPKIIGRE